MKPKSSQLNSNNVFHPSKRLFMQGALGAVVTVNSSALFASIPPTQEKCIEIRNLHTGESIKTTFWANGEYLNDELQTMNKVLRDHRSNDVHPMDPALFDLLHALQQSVGVSGAFQIISGYRSEETNQMLRNNSTKVARRSLHMRGKAVDIRLPGCDLERLQASALALKAGGVGYYPRSNFIHVDTGRVRFW